MTVLATWAPEDAVLGAVAPLALAAAAGTCLVVHLDDLGAGEGEATLAELVADGPRGSHLVPDRRGVAVIRNGGIAAGEALDVVAALASGWPAVVLARRTGPDRPQGRGLVPVVVEGVTAGGQVRGPRVVQRVRRRRIDAEPGVVLLPAVSRASIEAMLAGRFPGPTRWMRRWRQVWGMRWV